MSQSASTVSRGWEFMATYSPALPNTGTITFDGASSYVAASFCDEVRLIATTGEKRQGYLHFDTSSIGTAMPTMAWLEYEVSSETNDFLNNSSLSLWQGADAIGSLDVPPDTDWSLSAFSEIVGSMDHAVGVKYRVQVDESLISTTGFSDFAIVPENVPVSPLTQFTEVFEQTSFKLIVRHTGEAVDNVKNF